MPFSLFLDEILNGTTKHLGKAVNGFHTGLVDILVLRSYIWSNLRLTQERLDALEIGFRKVLYHYGDSLSMAVLICGIEKQMFL